MHALLEDRLPHDSIYAKKLDSTFTYVLCIDGRQKANVWQVLVFIAHILKEFRDFLYRFEPILTRHIVIHYD